MSSTALCSVAAVTMWSPRSRDTPGDALHREVVALGGAAGEDDLARRGASRRGHLVAGGIDGILGLPAEGVVPAGGVAVALR